MSEKKWYALRVYSGKEARVKAHIENEVKLQDIEKKIGNIIIPSENIIEMKDGKKRVKNRTFFPGYMIIEMELDNQTMHVISNAPGVVSFVGPKNEPTPLRPGEVKSILGKIEKSRETEVKGKISIPFKVGDPIRVVDGPFNDFTGFVEEINEEKNKVKVNISIFGRPTPVELDFLQIELEK
ncbi:MAG: transcription termination/antitermination factor NusG [Calditrichaceae bacterium]|nr:transcription termination/antitermination factor NusG [Calditrichaceae bacterium]MBN2708403.1 transcription termination/antitermination factor NusG [Calditrichaceae bacterium]RQV94618.1 MAG: transcription termination/antitermination factor NusG [Calditrichota bacterium]